MGGSLVGVEEFETNLKLEKKAELFPEREKGSWVKGQMDRSSPPVDLHPPG